LKISRLFNELRTTPSPSLVRRGEWNC